MPWSLVNKFDLSSYHHFVWLALIENNSILTSFSTSSKLNMKSKHTSSKKMPEKIKKLAQYFVNPSLQGSRDELLMDWSADVPEVWSSPIPCVLLPNKDVRGKRRIESNNSGPLSYASPSIWKYIPTVKSSPNIQAHLPQQLPFSQYVL